MGRGRKSLTYLLSGLVIVALHYIIPFTYLRDAKGFELYTFWGFLACIWFGATLAYLRRW